MPTGYPREFRDDVGAIARQGEIPIRQAAAEVPVGFRAHDTSTSPGAR